MAKLCYSIGKPLRAVIGLKGGDVMAETQGLLCLREIKLKPII
jgi:hypothetical protein